MRTQTMCVRCSEVTADWFCPACDAKWKAERAAEFRASFTEQVETVLKVYLSPALCTELANKLYDAINVSDRLCENCEQEHYNFKYEMHFDDFAVTDRRA